MKSNIEKLIEKVVERNEELCNILNDKEDELVRVKKCLACVLAATNRYYEVSYDLYNQINHHKLKIYNSESAPVLVIELRKDYND